VPWLGRGEYDQLFPARPSPPKEASKLPTNPRAIQIVVQFGFNVCDCGL
jgi:hypothetical protein